MPSAAGQIFEKVDALLEAILPAGGEYARMPMGDPATFPALFTYDDGETPIERESGNSRMALRFSVEGYVQGGSGKTAHAALLDLHAASVKALCADPTLGNLVETIEPVGQRRVDTAELASKRRLGFAQDFEVQYATVRGDPSQFA